MKRTWITGSNTTHETHESDMLQHPFSARCLKSCLTGPHIRTLGCCVVLAVPFRNMCQLNTPKIEKQNMLGSEFNSSSHPALICTSKSHQLSHVLDHHSKTSADGVRLNVTFMKIAFSSRLFVVHASSSWNSSKWKSVSLKSLVMNKSEPTRLRVAFGVIWRLQDLLSDHLSLSQDLLYPQSGPCPCRYCICCPFPNVNSERGLRMSVESQGMRSPFMMPLT